MHPQSFYASIKEAVLNAKTWESDELISKTKSGDFLYEKVKFYPFFFRNKLEGYIAIKLDRTKETLMLNELTQKNEQIKIQSSIDKLTGFGNYFALTEILEAKKEALLAYVDEIIMENDFDTYSELAQRLMDGRDAKQVLASVLRHVYEDEFLPENYNEITDVKVKIDDKTRLFIALGSKDGYNVGRLLDLLNKKAKTPGRKVKDVKIMDKYSFITVPLQEAEYIMRALNSKKDAKPLVEEATGSRNGGGEKSGKKSDRRRDRKGRKKSSDKKSGKSGKKSDKSSKGKKDKKTRKVKK